MKLKPLDDRVVIEIREELAEKNVGGIIIPDTAKEKPQMAEIIAVGTDEDLQKLVKIGDRVIFSKYGGDEFDLDGKKIKVISRSDILAVIE
ncbi:MAG TPA: co-chaperone GroES [Bacteroidetes bacterium]|nr:co-chaperone GroES [Bacteroidota bacterium]